MAVGFRIGDLAWTGTIPLDGVFQSIADRYQAGQTYPEGGQAADSQRIFYNVKQIGFNASTVLAVTSLALTALTMVSIFYGVCFTAAFLCARALISQNIRVMLTPASVEGPVREGAAHDPDFQVLDDLSAIWGRLFPAKTEEAPVATLREEWIPAYKVGGVAIWRNLILESDLQRVQ